MNEEIKQEQDKMVDFVIRAKNLQNESGLGVGLSMEGLPLIPVDTFLEALWNSTIRKDLKEKIEKALPNIKINK